MTRYVALLRAVNVGRRRVEMARARELLTDLGYDDVDSFVNSGNLVLSSDAAAATVEKQVRAALEDEYGFEITTFVRNAKQLRTLAGADPFGSIADGHTHFVLFPLTKFTPIERRAVLELANGHDELEIRGQDVHWLIHAKSTETTLGPQQWQRALPDNPTTARNVTMLRRLVARL
ncbi:DUF1697 domain-containing protein [uncultured Jatrophihabitans sp.]|uniref:DUF1697 domain-containing protein n=1 Tax=uncultured Jatrophihabitans sp. TaxID=1610747 RepID=UPI0035CACF04